MRILNGGIAALALACAGCTTLASGVTQGPPGVNKYSFRECLLNQGFYSPQNLSGIAKDDWKARHAERDAQGQHEKKAPFTRDDWLEQKPVTFVTKAATIIGNGLMPAVEYWQGDDPTIGGTTPPDGDPDHGLNRSYVLIPAPKPFPVAIDSKFDDGASYPHLTGLNERPDWRLNRFLDCYVAPVGTNTDNGANPIPSKNGDDDLEGRLLRGHIMLTLLAQFGTEIVVSHASHRQVAQAELLLGHIAEAEKALRSASLVESAQARSDIGDKGFTLTDANGTTVATFDDATALVYNATTNKYQPTLQWFGFATRLLRVFQVGVDIERIDAEQSLDRAGNLVAAFGGKIGGFLPILRDSLAGIVTMQTTRIYGDAYLRDARQTLAVHRALTVTDQNGKWTYDIAGVQHGWKLWDQQIDRACQVLATVAKKDETAAECVPDLSAKSDASAPAVTPAVASPAPAPAAQ